VDFAVEPMGVLNETIIAGDTIPATLLINKQPAPQQFIKAASRIPPGKLVTAFAKPAENITWKFLNKAPESVILQWNGSRDTLTLFGLPYIDDSTLVEWYESNTIIDTVLYRTEKDRKKSVIKTDSVIKATAVTIPLNGMELPAESDPTLAWNVPLKTFNFSEVKAFLDSIEIPVNGRFADSLQALTSFSGNWEEGTYKLLIPANSAMDLYGNTNDTIHFSFSVPAENTTGSIALKINDEKHEDYLVQIVNEKDELQRQRKVKAGTENIFMKFAPGIYRLRIVLDQNRNNRWDGGNWMEKQWPEKVIYYPDMITVRANWEVEINWNLEGK
jgi:hypothetical protein